MGCRQRCSNGSRSRRQLAAEPHFWGLTLDECKDACVGMGGCAELLVVSANGCCFPARSSCDGAKLPNEKKYVFDTCTIPPPPAPPPAILSPPQPSDGSPACFSDAPAGSHWCGATHPGQQGYDADSGAAMAAAAGGNWQLNPTFGWHFCG